MNKEKKKERKEKRRREEGRRERGKVNALHDFQVNLRKKYNIHSLNIMLFTK